MGLGESYVAGDWRADDLPRLFEILIGSVDAWRRELAARPARAVPPARLAAAEPPPRPAEHRLPLRPRQRAVPALPRRVDDLLVRDLGGGRHARRRAAPQAPARVRAARARPGRPRARDRLRLGLVRPHGRRGVRRARDRADALRAAGGAGARAAAGVDVEIRLQDYRTVEGQFTKIASIEMLEAIGHAQYPVYFQRDRPAARPRRPRLRPGDRDAGRALRALPPPRRLDPPLHLPGLAAPVGRGARAGDGGNVAAGSRRWTTSGRTTRRPCRRGASGSWRGSTTCARSATTSASSGRGSSTSPTARRRSARGRSATSSSSSLAIAESVLQARVLGAGASQVTRVQGRAA